MTEAGDKSAFGLHTYPSVRLYNEIIVQAGFVANNAHVGVKIRF